jgi:hypothetical protein
MSGSPRPVLRTGCRRNVIIVGPIPARASLGVGLGHLLLAGRAPAHLPSGKADPGMLIARHGSAREALPAFIKAIARHRHHERETDPPVL